MTYSVKEITDKNVWDEFIDRQKPSSFLHSYAWGEVEKYSGNNVQRIGVYNDAQLVAVVLAVIVRARRGSMLIVPHGPLIEKSDTHLPEKEILATLRDRLIQVGKDNACVVVRACPLLEDNQTNQLLFKSLGFKPAPIHVYTELSWMLDITPDEEQLLSGMKKNTRYGIKKAVRDGITIESSDKPEDIELFWKLYSETAKRQEFVPYSKKMIAAEFEQFSKEGKARWYFAYYKSEIISTAFIVYNNHSAFYHHGASAAHSAITPGELLQWQIILDAKARGLSRYNFWGVVPDDKTGHPWYGLSKFKKGFGGYGEAYLHAHDYPLSWKYGITYIIETIRRWKRNV